MPIKSIALLLAAAASIPALASPANAGPLQDVTARVSANAGSTTQLAMLQHRDRRSRRAHDRSSRDRGHARSEHRREHRSDSRRGQRHDSRSDHRRTERRHDSRRDRRRASQRAERYRDQSRERARDYRRAERRRDHYRDNRRIQQRYQRARQVRHNYRDWNSSWRNDRRYNWQSYRQSNRNAYRLGRYYSPYRNRSYSRLTIGFNLGSGYYSSRYRISDPYRYRLPPARGSLQWVRYYNDALLVDTRDGYIADVIYDIFW